MTSVNFHDKWRAIFLDIWRILSTNPLSIKFTGGQAVLGLSGAPMLNERTGGVCGIIYGTRDRSSLL